MTTFVAYARVSTAQQGRSGLGLEAQQQAINSYLKPGDTLLVPTYVEVESGKRTDRPELAKAINRAKLTGSTLLVAKLDRLTRNAKFLVDAGGGCLTQQRDLTPENLANMLQKIERDTLVSRAIQAQKMQKIEATARVVAACEELAT